jgi:hypothetical protein
MSEVLEVKLAGRPRLTDYNPFIKANHAMAGKGFPGSAPNV